MFPSHVSPWEQGTLLLVDESAVEGKLARLRADSGNTGRLTPVPPVENQRMLIAPIPSALEHEAVRLWRDCGLVRPWNDPDADLARALDGPSSTVLGAVADEQLLGTVMVGHDGHRGWVYYLAVQPDHRGNGLGRELMSAAESWLREQGVPKLQLMVRADNSAVIEFYKRLGYVDQQVAVLGRFFDKELQELRDQKSSERLR